MFSPSTRLAVRISLLCAASISPSCVSTSRAEVPTTARINYEADANDYDVVGTVVREWNQERQRNEFVIHDKRDDIRYVILSGSAVDRAELVGHRVALNGKTCLREDLFEGLIHPDEVRFLSNPVKPAQFVRPDRSTPPQTRPSKGLSPSLESLRVRYDVKPSPDDLGPSEVSAPSPEYTQVAAAPRDAYVGAPRINFGLQGWLRNNFQSGRLYFGLDYLLWKNTGMKLPPLVTGNPIGTPTDYVGVIGDPSTTILLGNGTILDEYNSGLRYTGGFWFSKQFALEAEAFYFHKQEDSFHYDSGLNLVLARPFINVAPLTGYTPIYDSQIATAAWVYASSEFYGAAIRGKFNLNCEVCDDSCADPCSIGCRPKPKCGWLNLTAGYRYLHLDEQLVIQEHLSAPPDEFYVTDSFSTRSRFHGLEVGFDSGFHGCFFDVSLFSRLAGGITRNQVGIAGTTYINGTPGDVGILAQPSNIGVGTYDTPSLVAEFGIGIQRQITRCLRLNLGYSVLYWGNVARAGEQIDLRVNPGLFEPPLPTPGLIGALPTHRYSDYVSHGLNLGATVVF